MNQKVKGMAALLGSATPTSKWPFYKENCQNDEFFCKGLYKLPSGGFPDFWSGNPPGGFRLDNIAGPNGLSFREKLLLRIRIVMLSNE